MVPNDPDHPNRRSIRLQGYDYRFSGAYFVTVCAQQKRSVFGRIADDAFRPNVYGQMVAECWTALPDHFECVELDEWVVMPNHFHGIIVIGEANNPNVGAQHAAPADVAGQHKILAGSLPVVVRSFKSAVTRAINSYRSENGMTSVVVWQSNFYERIIRNEKELDHTRRYIAENPLKWSSDSENPYV